MSTQERASETLRERRRQQTAREIHVAALRLAREHGFGKVSVEMIVAEAGVSRRTFFNYFPSKEAAVLSGPPPLPTGLLDAFVAAGPAHPGQVLADLVRVLAAGLTADPPRLQEVHDMFEVAGTDPHLQAALSAGFDAFRRDNADAVARRLGPLAGDVVPGLVAGMALGAVYSALERWAEQGLDESLAQCLEQAVEALQTVLRPDVAGGEE